MKKGLGIFTFAMMALIGFGMVSAHGFGMWGHDLDEDQKAEMQENMDALRAAIEDGDYDAWESLMNEQIARMQENINEETFNEMVERHAEMSEMRENLEGKDHFQVRGFHEMRKLDKE